MLSGAAVAIVGLLAWCAWVINFPIDSRQDATLAMSETVVAPEPVLPETDDSAPEPEAVAVPLDLLSPQQPAIAESSAVDVAPALPSGVSLARLAHLCEHHGRLSKEANEKVKQLLAADPEIASVVEAKFRVLANCARFLTYTHGLEIPDLRPLMLDQLRGAEFRAEQIQTFAGSIDAENIPFRSAKSAEEFAALVRQITPLWEISYERLRKKLGVSKEHGQLIFSAVYSARLKQLIEVNVERFGYKMDSAPKSHQPIEISPRP
jgi:hypothetical protein